MDVFFEKSIFPPRIIKVLHPKSFPPKYYPPQPLSPFALMYVFSIHLFLYQNNIFKTYLIRWAPFGTIFLQGFHSESFFYV